MRLLKRVVLEMSLKLFKQTNEEWMRKISRDVFRQWSVLLEKSKTVSVLLWIADGSEILAWRGELDETVEWAKYIGFCNTDYHAYTGDEFSPQRVAKTYIHNPPVLTYRHIKRIVTLLKETAKELGIELTVGATFDPGPEFAPSQFKYKDHPEIIVDRYNSSIGETIAEVNHASKLHKDTNAYAAFPGGIEEGTSFGTFLGKQTQSFLETLSFDYIWLSNGFGFTPYPWTMLGDNFDGEKFSKANFQKASQALIGFWEDFTAECKYSVEVRGTNFSTGIDLAKDCIPLRELYKYIKLPPPNSPWGALNFDFGLELAGYMSRIAQIPGQSFPFRYYINDPWFWQNPWFDLYEGEPFDIYLPLSISRIDSEGQVQSAKLVELLSIDTEQGLLPEACPREVIPHIIRAVEEAPDEVGPLTWLYPFAEYHQHSRQEPQSSLPFFGDFYARSAINCGFPLNTVLSSGNFNKLMAANPQKLLGTIFFALVPSSGTYEDQLCQLIEAGGQAILYGPIAAGASKIRGMLGLAQTEPLAGELKLTIFSELDLFRTKGPEKLKHDPNISGGPITEILAEEDDFTKVEAVVTQNGAQRIYALSRSLPSWNGGRLSWVRGSLPFSTKREEGEELRMPKDYPAEYIDAAILPRYLLSAFGYRLRQMREAESTPASLLSVSRFRNGFIFSGCQTNLTNQLFLELPDGAPVLVGMEMEVAGRKGTYTFPRTIRRECRLFVEQQERSIISCRQQAPFPTGKERRLRITNLKAAQVVVYPPVERITQFIAEENGVELAAVRVEKTENKVILKNITGNLEVAW